MLGGISWDAVWQRNKNIREQSWQSDPTIPTCSSFLKQIRLIKKKKTLEARDWNSISDFCAMYLKKLIIQTIVFDIFQYLGHEGVSKSTWSWWDINKY